MSKIELQPGDMAVVKTNSFIAGAINTAQRWLSRDGKAEYNHAFLIIDSHGNTYESLKKIGHCSLSKYSGCPVMIVRHKKMDIDAFGAGYMHILKYDGKIYPFWRLPLHFLRLAQYIHWSYPVCSELVGLFLNKAGLFGSTGWGWSPDDLADLWHESKHYDIVYQGVYDA